MSDSRPPDPSGSYPPPGQQQSGAPQQQPGAPQQPGMPWQPQQPNVQQPPPGPQPGANPVPAPNQARPSGGGKPLLFGAIGVVAGLVVGVFAGSFFTGGGGGTGPDADAQAACRYVEASVGEVSEESMALDQPLIWQLQGAGALAQAAATGDSSYAAFGEQGMDLFQAMSRLDLELAQTTLEAMEQSCADF